MILDDTDIKERMESPDNLLNRLRSAFNPHKKPTLIPTIPPPTADIIIPNLDEKINLGNMKSKAMAIMNEAMDELKTRLPEVQKPERLAIIVKEMGQVVQAQTNQSINDNRIGQIIVYSPRIISEDNFETVDSKGME